MMMQEKKKKMMRRTEEEEEGEEGDQKDSEGVAVPFPPLDLTITNSSSDGVERSSSKLWGVRSHRGANGLLGPQVIRTSNPTEDKIAKEIRELKEREEELLRRREMSKSPTTTMSTTSLQPSPTSVSTPNLTV